MLLRSKANGQHLRDGFTRAVLARQKAARTAGLLTEADETVSDPPWCQVFFLCPQRIATSLQDFKALFPAQTVPKGKSLVLLRAANGDLVVEYEVRALLRASSHAAEQSAWIRQRPLGVAGTHARVLCRQRRHFTKAKRGRCEGVRVICQGIMSLKPTRLDVMHHLYPAQMRCPS